MKRDTIIILIALVICTAVLLFPRKQPNIRINAEPAHTVIERLDRIETAIDSIKTLQFVTVIPQSHVADSLWRWVDRLARATMEMKSEKRWYEMARRDF